MREISGICRRPEFPGTSPCAFFRRNGAQGRFAFTPYLGEYAVITLENTGSDDVSIVLRRPNTVGNRKGGAFDTVRIPAGQTPVRAFRIDGKLPLENQLDLTASSFTDQPVQLTLTAEQYRFGVKK